MRPSRVRLVRVNREELKTISCVHMCRFRCRLRWKRKGKVGRNSIGGTSVGGTDVSVHFWKSAHLERPWVWDNSSKIFETKTIFYKNYEVRVTDFTKCSSTQNRLKPSLSENHWNWVCGSARPRAADLRSCNERWGSYGSVPQFWASCATAFHTRNAWCVWRPNLGEKAWRRR